MDTDVPAERNVAISFCGHSVFKSQPKLVGLEISTLNPQMTDTKSIFRA